MQSRMKLRFGAVSRSRRLCARNSRRSSPNLDAAIRFSCGASLSRARAGAPRVRRRRTEDSLLYSYCGVFGDPLLNPELDPYPDGLLQQLSDLGVNGVWLHVVLRQLAPTSLFPEMDGACERRIANLRRLVSVRRAMGSTSTST